MVEYVKALYGLYVPEGSFEGQGMVEYALILALVAVAAIAILMTMSGSIKSIFTTVSTTLSNAAGG